MIWLLRIRTSRTSGYGMLSTTFPPCSVLLDTSIPRTVGGLSALTCWADVPRSRPDALMSTRLIRMSSEPSRMMMPFLERRFTASTATRLLPQFIRMSIPGPSTRTSSKPSMRRIEYCPVLLDSACRMASASSFKRVPLGNDTPPKAPPGMGLVLALMR